MKMYIVLILFFSFHLKAITTDEIDCGHVKLGGVVRHLSGTPGLFLVINEKTYSEMKFAIDINEEIKLAPYSDKVITLQADILQKNSNGPIMIQNLADLNRELPDPLGINDELGFKQISKEVCK